VESGRASARFPSRRNGWPPTSPGCPTRPATDRKSTVGTRRAGIYSPPDRPSLPAQPGTSFDCTRDSNVNVAILAQISDPNAVKLLSLEWTDSTAYIGEPASDFRSRKKTISQAFYHTRSGDAAISSTNIIGYDTPVGNGCRQQLCIKIVSFPFFPLFSPKTTTVEFNNISSSILFYCRSFIFNRAIRIPGTTLHSAQGSLLDNGVLLNHFFTKC